jgi:hypothetical protein
LFKTAQLSVQNRYGPLSSGLSDPRKWNERHICCLFVDNRGMSLPPTCLLPPTIVVVVPSNKTALDRPNWSTG